MTTQPNQSNTILVVDDDPSIREVVRFALEKAGYATLEAGDGKEALEKFAAQTPQLIVLDILMPEFDGTEVCRRIRRTSDVPIIFLSSRDDEIDRVLGLELGGDDYVTKPFSPRELVARVKAVMRRLDDRREQEASEDDTSESNVLEHGKLRLDLDRFKVFWGSTELVLTVTEFGMLRTLISYPGKVFSRSELMRGAYKDQTIVSDRTIDSHITRVRRKFEDIGASPIETVHGLGYKCGDCRE
ncbi:MAG: response regulator transcription factor [Myxococcota bacterium]|nr:response regulator transcription factor [Myxococcota bacterium]